MRVARGFGTTSLALAHVLGYSWEGMFQIENLPQRKTHGPCCAEDAMKGLTMTSTTKARRMRGSGSVYKKGTNRTYVIQYYVQGFRKTKAGELVLDGKGRPIPARIRVREATGFTSQRKAQDLLTARLAQIGRGEWTERERRPATIEELYLALKDNNLNNRKGRPRELPGRWKNLSPAFAAMAAERLTTDHVQLYIRQRQEKGAANATINRELATLKRMFRLGTECTPPKVRVVPHIPMLRENNVRKGFVEDANFSRLVAEASELWLRTFLELGYSYGWRGSELLELRVRQLNFDHGTIRLDPGTTKNLEGREVAMTAKAGELLREATRGKHPDDFVLTRTGGKPVKDFRDAWQSMCKRAGLGQFVCAKCDEAVSRPKCVCGGRRKYLGLIPHDLRRSAAKAARRAGVPESVVMAMGGWKTAAIFRRYAIVSSADQRAAVDMLEKARAENGPRSAPISENMRLVQSETLTGKVQ